MDSNRNGTLVHAMLIAVAAMSFFDLASTQSGIIWSTYASFSTFANNICIPLYAVFSLVYILLLSLRHSRISAKSVEPSPIRASPSQSIQPATNTTSDESDSDEVVNLSGTYRFVRHENMEEFLIAQGASWALRKAALKLQPLQQIKQNGDIVNIRITTGSVMTVETSYVIGGPPVETKIRKRAFRDTMNYMPDKTGIQIKKVPIDPIFPTLLVTRILSADKNTLVMTSTMLGEEEGKEKLAGIQYYERVK